MTRCGLPLALNKKTITWKSADPGERFLLTAKHFAPHLAWTSSHHPLMCWKHRPPGKRRPVGLRVVPHNTLCTSCPMALVLAGPIERSVSMRAYLKTSKLWQARASHAVTNEVLWRSITWPRPNRGIAVHGGFRFRRRGLLTSTTFGL